VSSSPSLPLLLVTNDDGIGAPGLQALAAALEDVGEVWVLAPDAERSAVSQAISIYRPLRLHEMRPRQYVLDGTPVDCVYVALHAVLPRRPTVVVTGVNPGPNLGTDVIYSGTVAAAREGALRGVHGIAVSLYDSGNNDHAARVVVDLVARVAKLPSVPTLLLNVNVPDAPLKGSRVTTLGRRLYQDEVDRRVDPRGRSYYWIGGPGVHMEHVGGSDVEAVQQGYVSVTPLELDLTDHAGVDRVRDLLDASPRGRGA
jgi:5'-nucleotidase